MTGRRMAAVAKGSQAQAARARSDSARNRQCSSDTCKAYSTVQCDFTQGCSTLNC